MMRNVRLPLWCSCVLFSVALLKGGNPASGQGQALARVQLTEGWATFGQVLPRGAAREGLRVGNLPTQTDVKNRWSDGSIKFAVVTAQVAKAGTYAITSGPASGKPFKPENENPGFFVTILHQNKDYSAGPDLNDLKDTWLKGPLVIESRQYLPLVDQTNFAHATLRVIFDVRQYKDGQIRYDVTLENTLDRRGADAVEYSLGVGNPQLKELVSRADVFHPYLTRWRLLFTKAMTASAVTPDLEPAYRAGALPRYLPIVNKDVNGFSADEQERFDLLRSGDLNPRMPDHGGRPELGPYPDWAATYLVHKNEAQKRYVLANGDLAGSWPVHLRKADGTMFSLDERPKFWLDVPLNRGEDKPAGNMAGVGQLIPDNAHQPSLAYIPYLLTGDRYYAEEMAFWANYCLLSTYPAGRGKRGSEGLLDSNETRGFAWTLRNLTDAAAYLPDGHPLRASFLQRVNNNLAWFDQHVQRNTGPLGVAWHRCPFDTGDNPTVDPEGKHAWQSAAQNNFLAWAVDHASKQGFRGGTGFRDQMAKFTIALLNNPTTRDGAAPYGTPIGDRNPPGSNKITWYTKLEQTYRGKVQYPGYYGADARLMCIIGLENGFAGAKEAYDYLHPLVAVEPFDQGVPDLVRRAGWALSPTVR